MTAVGLSLAFSTALAGPQPINTEFDDQTVLLRLPEPSLVETAAPSDPEQLADRVQKQIQAARSQGDPRFLGYAQGLLQQWDRPKTDRLQVLQATIEQSNHRFDQARELLNQVLRNSRDRQQALQALLMLASIDMVQGDYESAASHCDQLAQRRPGLIAASCQAQVMARTGQPKTAYESLKQQLNRGRGVSDVARLWAEGTLGDIAAQLGDPAANNHWSLVLQSDPDDLYIRARLADWYLNRQMPDKTLTLTENYEAVDSLAVIRAIALEKANDADAPRLAQALKERFTEAQWRGNLLHKRDFARYLLDIADQPEQALATAKDNWTDQREPPDTRLLLRAAIASGNTAQIETVNRWLAKNNQQDARYPEVQE